MFKNKFILISILVAIFLVGAAFWFKSVLVEAQTSTRPFGGQILSVIQCDCSYGHVVTLGPPTPGLYHFIPSTTLYSFFQTQKIGAWLLGNYFPGTSGQCKRYVGISCADVPNLGVMQMVGTSQ